MKKYKVLILTDHTNHGKENSVYPISNTLLKHPLTNRVDIATRGILENDNFFKYLKPEKIWATEVNEKFGFSENGLLFKQNMKKVNLSDYDLIWLRLPPPVDKSFLSFLDIEYSDHFIINAPSGIYETGSKAFLMKFRELCAPMRICNSIEDIIQLKKRFPIVLKPFHEYGGKGIIRIDGEKVWYGKEQMTFSELIANLEKRKIEYLGVKYLKNVVQGDKRIVVIDGKIMGASLRLPSNDSWICNIAMGGTSHITDINEEENKIIKVVNPVLSKMGIVMYGIDTLVDDNGKRVLSEINTTSIGGLPQIALLKKLPLIEEAIDLIWSYFIKNQKNAE